MNTPPALMHTRFELHSSVQELTEMEARSNAVDVLYIEAGVNGAAEALDLVYSTPVCGDTIARYRKRHTK